MIQRILFPVSHFNPKKIHAWLAEHGYRAIKLTKYANYYAARLTVPRKGDRYISKRLPNGAILTIVKN